MNKVIPTIAVTLSTLFGASVQAQDYNFPHISTTGFGEVVAKPDMAQFSVTVAETTMNAEQAKAAVDKVVEGFLTELKSRGVKAEQISSSNLYLAPQYHYPKTGKAELVGYRATRSVTVDVNELSRLNDYLDVALAKGINQVNNIQLKVRDQEKYQEQARMAAIKDAANKARSLASGFGSDIGQVWSIEYSPMNVQPVMMRAMSMEAKADTNSYQDSTMVIRDRVDVVYKLKE